MQATTTTSEQEWLTTQEAADYTKRARKVIERALRDGSLHGAQSGHGGRWRTKRECIDAWVFGQHCPHHRSAR